MDFLQHWRSNGKSKCFMEMRAIYPFTEFIPNLFLFCQLRNLSPTRVKIQTRSLKLIKLILLGYLLRPFYTLGIVNMFLWSLELSIFDIYSQFLEIMKQKNRDKNKRIFSIKGKNSLQKKDV